MTAAKHLDPIVGIDMHMVQMPAPGPPVMLPVPFVGYLLDPADYAGGCTTHINGLPRARAGTPGMGMPPHIPPGGVFIKPPSDECEMYEGSSSVVIDGDAASAMGHQVLSCHDVGMPAPVRAWKKSPAKSLMTAASVVLPIPGKPVMIGGSPTTSASATADRAEREDREPVLETVELRVFDGLEMPMRNERFELHLANGDVEEGSLDATGAATVCDVPEGFALLVLPDVDEPPANRTLRSAAPSLSSPNIVRELESGAHITHVVSRFGETVRGICLDHGVVNWRAVFLDGSNATLRSERPNPDMLQVGDELRIACPEVPFVDYLAGGVALRTGTPRVTIRVRIPRLISFSQ